MKASIENRCQAAFELAVSHHQAGRLAEAEKSYRKILESKPGHAGALHLLGMIGHQTGNPGLAVKLIAKAVAIAPDYAEAHNNLGNALKDLGRLDEAVACYRRAIAIVPDYAKAHNNLGSALADRGETGEAIARYRKALELAPDDAVAHYNLGNALRDTDRPEQAAACYRRAIEIAPRFAEARLNLGKALGAQGKPDEAAACHDRALEIAPAYAEAHLSLGDLHRSQGRPGVAAACYRRAIEADLGHADAQLGLGRAFQDQGKLDEAIACYRRTIDLAPDCADAHYALSTLLNTVDQPAEAKRALAEGCRLRPITTAACTAGKPLATILKLVGLPSTRLSLKDGRPTITGGNLDTSLLLDRTKFTTHEFFVHRDNLLDMAADLPPHDIVLNGIVDPDVEMASLNTAQAFIARQNAPFINDPAMVRLTTRDNVYQRLTGIDNLVVPKVVRETLAANDPSLFMPIVEKHGLGFPLIVRFAGGHVGAGMTKVDREEDFTQVPFMTNIPVFYFIEHHDYRSDDGYYRKMRFFFVDGKRYPVHLLISNQWNIHTGARHEFMKNNAWMTDEENAFLEDPGAYLGQRNCSALEEIDRRIGLDVFGVDYAMLPNGKLLLFEANAAMRVTMDAWHAEFPYKIRHTNKIKTAFEEMMLAKTRR